MAEFYTWEDPTMAQAMLDHINGDPGLPDSMIEWAGGLTQWTDGRVGFKRIPESILEVIGVSQEERDAILEAYGPIIVDASELPNDIAHQAWLDSGEV